MNGPFNWYIFIFRSVKFQSAQKRKVIVEEEIIEEESSSKTQKLTEDTKQLDPSKESMNKPSSSDNSWNRSVGVIPRKNALSGLVKIKNQKTETVNSSTSSITSTSSSTSNMISSSGSNSNENEVTSTNGLSLLGTYSGSDESSDNDWGNSS